MLERIEQTIAAIKTKIINDEDVRKLLFHDSNNALNMLAPTVLETDSYITTKPVYEFENKNEYNQNSMVNIYMIEIVPTDDVKAFVGAVQVNVTCNLDIWDLLDNKIRPIQIPVLKAMVESTIHGFFSNSILVENGIDYEEALKEMIQIILHHF